MARPSISSTDYTLKRVRVPERGYTDIDVETWSVLQVSSDFLRLHAEGILDVVYRPLDRVRLKGTCYVGHAICGTVLLEFCEKVDGALTALLVFASNETFRLAKAKAATSELGSLVVLLVSQFVDVVALYASSGRKFQYGTQSSIGSLAGGKLNIGKCLQLRAKGRGHLLAFEKNVAVFNNPINRIVLAALSEVESIGRILGLPEQVTAKSRGLSMLFSDCRDHETLYRERSYFAKEALRFSETENDDLSRDLMALASVVLSRESFDSSSGRSANLPRTWFVNLEKLFEKAVRNVLNDICTDATVIRGGASPQKIFSNEQKAYRANPDIVISMTGRGSVVGDVKYKVFEGSAGASDVYQLLVHADAFEANCAFLIFPGDSYSVRSLGASKGGIDVKFFSVRIDYLSVDIAAMAAELGFFTCALDMLEN